MPYQLDSLIRLLSARSPLDDRERKLLASLEALPRRQAERAPSCIAANELLHTYTIRKQGQAARGVSVWRGFDSPLLERLAQMGQAPVCLLAPTIGDTMYMIFYTEEEFTGFLDAKTSELPFYVPT